MAQPAPQKGREDEKAKPDSLMIQQFAGLKNTVNPERMAPGDLVRATNIDLDDVGQARRRRGKTKVNTSAHHSIYNFGTIVYGVRGTELGIIYPDYSFESLKTGIGPEPIAYVTVGDDVFFSSLDNSGVIHADKTVDDWGAVTSEGTWLSPVINPTSTLSEISGKLLGKPPMATSLCLYNGRIYLANERTLWATELYMYNYVDKTRNYILFESEITVLGTVDTGMYVGTRDGVYYLTGVLGQMKQSKVLNAAAIPGSLVNVTAELVRPERNASKQAVVFMTTAGLVAGLDAGFIHNMTETKVLFPDATSSAAMFRQQDGINQYVGVTDTAGTPSSTARVGDYVDAEIRRFQGV